MSHPANPVPTRSGHAVKAAGRPHGIMLPTTVLGDGSVKKLDNLDQKFRKTHK